MNWTRIALAILASGVAGSLTDWLFMGVLPHGKYFASPEVWRNKPGESEATLIIWSTLLGVMSCAVYVLVCARLGLQTWSATVKFAAAVWAMAAVPILVNNGLWTKIHPVVTVAHLAGWLARFLVCAVAVMLLLP